MGSFTDTALAGLRNTFLHKQQEGVSRQRGNADVLSAIEKVVDGTDSRIRLVNSYKKKLQDGVVTALDFIDERVARIPGALEISSRSFISDPYVNAFFVNINDLQNVFSHSSEIRDFIEVYGELENLQCCCLLCMQKTERSTLGMELSGEILKKDVQQTAVSFSDHRIYSPAPTEAAARDGLKECLLGGLITNALERIMRAKVENNRLQSDRQMLYVKLRHLEYKAKNTTMGLREHADTTAEITHTLERIRIVEDKLMSIRSVTPQESLNYVNNLLKGPENYIRFKKSTLKLDKMGIVIDDNSSRPCNLLHLTEVVIGEEQPRVVTLAQIPMAECYPQAEFLSQKLFS
jgi:hypothetical protein